MKNLTKIFEIQNIKYYICTTLTCVFAQLKNLALDGRDFLGFIGGCFVTAPFLRGFCYSPFG